MTAARLQPRQRGAIHAIRKKIGMDEASYRGLLQGFGAASSSDLSEADADRVIERLRALEGSATQVRPVSAAKAAGRYAPKLQAMWLALYNLGAVEDRRDTAMHTFVERQTGIQHTRFLRDPADASKAIEALKSWMIRVGGVRWPLPTKDREADRLAIKREILRAQWLRCIRLGAVQALGPPEACDGLVDYVSAVVRNGSRLLGSLEDASVTAADLDKASAALGGKLRRAKGKT